MEVGAVEDGSRLIRTDKAVVFRDIVGVVGPGGAARARCTCAVEVGVPVRVDAPETGRDGQGRGVGVGVDLGWAQKYLAAGRWDDCFPSCSVITCDSGRGDLSAREPRCSDAVQRRGS